MRKTFMLVFLFLAVTLTSQSQNAEFFAGKWEVTVVGTPNGNSVLVADLVRSDGKLSGTLTNKAEPESPKIPITAIEEDGDKISMSFTAQDYDVTLDLSKVDEDNLKGNLLGMFEATAKRVK